MNKNTFLKEFSQNDFEEQVKRKRLFKSEGHNNI